MTVLTILLQWLRFLRSLALTWT